MKDWVPEYYSRINAGMGTVAPTPEWIKPLIADRMTLADALEDVRARRARLASTQNAHAAGHRVRNVVTGQIIMVTS